MFMEIAVTAIGIAIVLMVGYLVVAQVKSALTGSITLDTNTTNAINNTQNVVFAGFTLLGVGVIVLAAFALISVFK